MHADVDIGVVHRCGTEWHPRGYGPASVLFFLSEIQKLTFIRARNRVAVGRVDGLLQE